MMLKSVVKIGLLYFFLISIFMGCKDHSFYVLEYLKAVKEEKYGLNTSKNVNGRQLKLQYLPLDYIALMGFESPPKNQSVLDSQIKNYQGKQYYSLSFKSIKENTVLPPQGDKVNSLDERVRYMAFGIQEDLTLIQGNDTLECEFVHFERTYRLTPHNKVHLIFRDPSFNHPGKQAEDRQLLIESPKLGVKKALLKIEGEAIRNFPLLKI